MEPIDNLVPLYEQKALKMPAECHSWCTDKLRSLEIHYCWTKKIETHKTHWMNTNLNWATKLKLNSKYYKTQDILMNSDLDVVKTV